MKSVFFALFYTLCLLASGLLRSKTALGMRSAFFQQSKTAVLQDIKSLTALVEFDQTAPTEIVLRTYFADLPSLAYGANGHLSPSFFWNLRIKSIFTSYL
jgi:hypothetical protein